MTTVIYHSADYDGIFCREIARKFLPGANLIGWNFGDPPLEIPNTALYVLDLPLDAPFGFDYRKVGNARGPQHPKGLVWIDHHKSSIDSHPKDIPGYRIDGVAACRLVWQWLAFDEPRDAYHLPEKQAFIDRSVSEPLAVRLAGEYDIWDKRDPRADTFQFALRVAELKQESWDCLLSSDSSYALELLRDGEVAQRYRQKVDADLVMHRSYRLQWEGLNFIVLNTGSFNSLTFSALDKPETGHDALLGYMFNGHHWTVSLYHAAHRKDLDLSTIAGKYGGGGHRGACGFTCNRLPFLPGTV